MSSAPAPADPDDVTPDERPLVADAQQSDSDAWTALYQNHFPAIYRYLWARVGDRTTAEDLASEVFLAAIRSIERYRSERPFLAWLFGIARNIALDHAHRPLRRAHIFGHFW